MPLGKDRSDQRLYGIWADMKKRCNNPELYAGAKGISYDPRWELYTNFLEDMLPGYELHLILDREDNEGDYTKANCRWVNYTVSNRNRSNVKLNMQLAEEIRSLYLKGNHTQKAIAKMFGVDRRTVNYIVNWKLWT